MSVAEKPWRVSWQLAPTAGDKRAPRAQHRDYAERSKADAHKDKLKRQYGAGVAACVTATPAPKVKTAAPKPPPPMVAEEPGSTFWVSAYVPPRDGRPAFVQHHGFANHDRAAACRAELKARGDAAVCLTTERPPGARIRHRGDGAA